MVKASRDGTNDYMFDKNACIVLTFVACDFIYK